MGGESSLNEEQISEDFSPMSEEEPSEVDEEEPNEVDDDELSPVDEEEEEPIDFDDPLFEQALREVNEEDRGEELSQTDEDQPSEDARPAAQPDQPHTTPPNSRRPKAPRAPRARQQWELYSFRGKDGKRWTLQRRVPRERE